MTRHLRFVDWLIILLSIATGLIHLVLGISQLNGSDLLPISFILNGLAYLALIVALYFLPQFKHMHGLLEWALIILAAATIVLYFVFNGMEGLSSPLGLITKGIELLLIIALVYDLGN
ncbi:MAG: hypothetical protein R3C44_07625 [Chloroflexota bacterium]